MDGREMLAQEGLGLVADVQVHVIQATLLHFEVDRARHHVARSQFGALVVFRHEAGAIGQLQQAAFATYGFRDQEGLGVGVIQAGRVELDEFHVRHPAARAPGHGDAVAGGRVGVGGVEIDLARATCRQHGVGCGNGLHFAAGVVQHVEAVAAVARQAKLARSDQVHREVVLDDRDIGMLARLLAQGGHDGMAGGVRRVDDAPAAMPAFARQVVAEFRLVVAGERHAAVDQPLDGFAPMLDDVARGAVIAKAGARHQGVLRVLIVAVARVQDSGNAALGPVAGALRHGTFANDDNPMGVGQLQRDRQTGQSAADNGDIEVHGARDARGTRSGGRKAGKCTPPAGSRGQASSVGQGVERRRLRNAAFAARKSKNPAWAGFLPTCRAIGMRKTGSIT